MWVQNCYKKDIPIDSNMNQEKVKSLCDNLKWKENKSSKAGEFNTSKGWCDNFRKRFGLKNVKVTEEAASADQEAAVFPDTIKKIIKEKKYLICLNSFLMQMKVPHSGEKKKKKMPQKTFISKEEIQALGLL